MAKRHYGNYSAFKRRDIRRPPSPAGRISTERFFGLLRQRGSVPRDGFDRRIEARCLDDLTVLTCDSSGFSRKTQEFGIIQFLAVMTECYDHLIPLLESKRGLCLSHNADNLMAVFKRPADAVEAALAMNRWLAGWNDGRPEAQQFHVCIGIHRGKLLRFKDNVFGDTVNIASKIGEDVAGKGEVLVTEKAARGLPKRFKLKPAKPVSIGLRSFKLSSVRSAR